MIDRKKIFVFKKYMGDPDAWARIATPEEKSLMSDNDWYLIQALIQSVLISSDKSQEFFLKNTNSEEVRAEIKAMAKSLNT